MFKNSFEKPGRPLESQCTFAENGAPSGCFSKLEKTSLATSSGRRLPILYYLKGTQEQPMFASAVLSTSFFHSSERWGVWLLRGSSGVRERWGPRREVWFLAPVWPSQCGKTKISHFSSLATTSSKHLIKSPPSNECKWSHLGGNHREDADIEIVGGHGKDRKRSWSQEFHKGGESEAEGMGQAYRPRCHRNLGEVTGLTGGWDGDLTN